MILAPDAAKHVAVGKADQGHVVGLAAAESRNAIGASGAQADGLRAGAKPLPHAMLPNRFGSWFETQFGR